MFSTPAFAQTAAGAPSGAAAFFMQVAPLLFIFVIFWFLVIRPQQKRMKDHRALIDAAKKGDVVITGGGLIGKVIKVDGDEIEIEISPNVRVRAIKGTLSDVRPLGSGKPAND